MLALVATLLASCPEECCCDHDADRTICGYTHFPKFASFEGSIALGGGINTALNAPAGLTTVSVAPPLNDQTLRLYGRKRGSDVQPGVIVTAENFIDSGTVFAIMPGGACQGTAIFSVSTNEIGFGSAFGHTCGSSADRQAGALVDQSGVSEHVTLTCSPRYFVTVQGKLGENQLNTAPDGGCDTVLPDGGCYLAYAALHGELTVTSSVARYAGGWLQEWRNPVSNGTGQARAFVDVWGGYGQRHGMIRAQFPKCPADVVVTFEPQLQFYYRGAVESTQLYAFDEHRYHICDGTQWTHLDGEACP